MKRIVVIGFILLVILSFVGYFTTGFYAIQPIGAIPDGVTFWVWRASDEPFFNSADATCMRRVGYVNLLCRGIALAKFAEVKDSKVIMSLPYFEWMYSTSTGGITFKE